MFPILESKGIRKGEIFIIDNKIKSLFWFMRNRLHYADIIPESDKYLLMYIQNKCYLYLKKVMFRKIFYSE